MKTRHVYITVVVLFCFLFIAQAGADSGYYTDPNLRAEYESICKEWSQARGNSEALGEIVESFENFAERNSGNIYSAVSLFNIGQVYSSLLNKEKEQQFYSEALKIIQQKRKEWDAKDDAATAQEYGGACALRLSVLAWRESDTVTSRQFLNVLINEFPDAGFTPIVLSTYFQDSGDNSELLKRLPKECRYVLDSYKGRYRKAMYKHSIGVYMQLAQNDIVKVKEFEGLVAEYYQACGSEINAQEKAIIDGWLHNLQKEKIAPLIKYE